MESAALSERCSSAAARNGHSSPAVARGVLQTPAMPLTARFVLVGITITAPLACDHEKKEEFLGDIGMGDGRPERLPGIYSTIPRGDLDEIGKVGVWVATGAHALELASKAVEERMGKVAGDVVLPIVDIDPAGTSGQVVFVRWPGAAITGGQLRVEDAQRWVLVALAFEPDRVIDVELLQGAIARGSVEERRVGALIVAGTELAKREPATPFFTVDRFQAEATGEKRTPQRTRTVVHALAQDDGGPDFEIAIEPPKKTKPKKPPAIPEVARVIEVHRSGTLAADPVAIDLPDPHPLSAARAIRSKRLLHVATQSGTYDVTADGVVTRMTTAP